jgi:hypothetical protein
MANGVMEDRTWGYLIGIFDGGYTLIKQQPWGIQHGNI